MKKTIMILILITISLTLFAVQKKNKSQLNEISSEEILEAVNEAKQDSIISTQSFEELTKDKRKIGGLFNLYVDSNTGEVYLELSPDQIGKEYLFTLTRQSGDAYFFDASAMMWSFPFYFKKVNRRIQLIQKNLKFRADEPAMKRAVENSISHSIVAATETIGKPNEETGAILIKADDIFLIDIANVQNVTGNWDIKFSFDKDNSYFTKLKSFPFNTELEVSLHYTSSNWNRAFTLPDSRSMSHSYHYSLSTLPDSDYKPRKADDRIGYFTTIFQDYSDLMKETPYVRYINRWHLEKKYPKKKSSPVKEPIVFWLENTIPQEYRPAVKAGVLSWNEAFAKIGLEDAIVVKDMPEDATWDPADARYNTIRWMIQPGGGYAVGPSHANPYTGEIYDADIRVSVDFLRYFFTEFEEMVSPNSWGTGVERSTWSENPGLNSITANYSSGLAQQMTFGWNTNLVKSEFVSQADLKKYVEAGIMSLIVHEVGHTLGLRHNFKASTIYNEQQLSDNNFTREHGICGSVMDYTSLNLYQLGNKNATFFQIQPGPWDEWVIEYGYAVFSADKEQKELEKIASRCTEPELDYGTDEDTFGLSTRGLDPLSCIFDLGADPISFYESRIKLTNEIWDSILKKFEKKEYSYNKILRVFNQGMGEYRLAAHNACRFIGGLYSHRDHIDDPKNRTPFEQVNYQDQQRALSFLTSYFFAPEAFDFDPDLLNKLVLDKNETFTGGIWTADRQDYPIHQKILEIQKIVFSHIFDPLVIKRIHDNELKFLKGEERFTLSNLFMELNSSIWSELDEPSSIISFRRQLQNLYVSELGKIILESNNYPEDALALARYSLLDIQKRLQGIEKNQLNLISSAHITQLKYEISSILNASIEKKS